MVVNDVTAGLLAGLAALVGMALIGMVRWLLERRRRRTDAWNIRCHDCAWSGRLEVACDLEDWDIVRAFIGIHYKATGHTVQATWDMR